MSSKSLKKLKTKVSNSKKTNENPIIRREVNDNENEISDATFVTESKVYEAVNVLKNVVEVNQKGIVNKKQLFEQDTNFVFLQLNLKKIPTNFSTFIHYISLPYHWRHEVNYETCLIVKDFNKEALSDRDADLEQTRDFYRNLLNKHSANELVSEILPMRQLRTEFSLPALRKKLSNEYNAFLCDKNLLRNKYSFLSRFLGKSFWIDNKNVPIPIKLDDEDLKTQINEKLNQTSLYVSGKGSTLTICVGLLQQDSTKLTKNLIVVLEKIKQLYDNNVRELAIKTGKSMSVLFYLDLDSANKIIISKPEDNQNLFVEDEFDFLTDSNVRVFKDGRIRIIKRNKPEDETNEDKKDEINIIKSINNEPDEEYWNRRLVFNIPKNFKKQKLTRKDRPVKNTKI